MKIRLLIGLLPVFVAFNVFSQDNLENWMNSTSAEGPIGVDTEKAYENLIKDKKANL